MIRKSIIGAAGMALTLLALPTQAAETSGSIDFGGQAVQGHTDSSKFEEYRDVPRGFFVERFGLQSTGATYYLTIEGFKPGLKDQRVDVELGEWGKHRLEIAYDQIPHNYSNTAQTFLIDRGNGVFTLPDNMQSSLQTSTSNAAGFFSDTPFVPLRVDRNKGTLAYGFNTEGKWRMNMAYSGEKKQGNKAIGVAFGHDSLEESLEPVKYQTHDLNVGTEFVGKDTGFSANYNFTYFLDEVKALTVDNPFRVTDAALSAAGASAPGKATLTLPPSNQTHQVNMAFTTKLPAKSRLQVLSSYSLQSQNDTFQPLTSNQNILNDPRLQPLARDNLEGRVDTWNAEAKWNWKPGRSSTVNVFGQNYNVNNRTPSLLVTQYVPYDATFSTAAPTATFNPSRSRTSLPIAYNKTNAGADAYWALAKPVSLKLAYEWEQYLREHRESTKTTENIYTALLNIKPHARLAFRPNYQYSRRAVHDYDADRVAHETFPLGEGTALGQLPELRKYDQASRERNKFGARADWDFIDNWNLGVDTAYTRDDYITDYGLLDEKDFYCSVDLGFIPSERVSFFGGYTAERLTGNTRSRYRATGLDTPANDWEGQLDDFVQTYNASLAWIVVKEKVDTDIGWSYSYARGVQQAHNPNTLQGTPSQIASAQATDFPNTYTRLHTLRAAVRYHWSSRFALRARYEYERYRETDWAQDTLDVYQPNWNKSVFLGATQPGYDAHIVFLGVSYAFL